MVKAVPEKDCKGCCWEKEIQESYKVGIYKLSDKFSFAINHSIQPKVFGHVVIMAKDHRDDTDVAELCAQEYNEFFGIARAVANILPDTVEAISGVKVENVYLMTLNESPEWHTHIHIIPRSITVNDSNRGTKIFDLPSTDIPKHDMKKLVATLQKGLADHGVTGL